MWDRQGQDSSLSQNKKYNNSLYLQQQQLQCFSPKTMGSTMELNRLTGRSHVFFPIILSYIQNHTLYPLLNQHFYFYYFYLNQFTLYT